MTLGLRLCHRDEKSETEWGGQHFKYLLPYNKMLDLEVFWNYYRVIKLSLTHFEESTNLCKSSRKQVGFIEIPDPRIGIGVNFTKVSVSGVQTKNQIC